MVDGVDIPVSDQTIRTGAIWFRLVLIIPDTYIHNCTQYTLRKNLPQTSNTASVSFETFFS